MEAQAKTNNRDFGIDLLRIVVMIMIPLLHVLGHGGILEKTEPFSLDYVYWFLEILCYGAVNIFGLISGYVGYGRKTKITNLVLLWIRAFIYSIVISIIFYAFRAHEFGWYGLLNDFFPTLFNRWWYWTAYVGLFIFMPLLNLGLEHINKKTAIITLIIMAALFSVLPTFLMRTGAFTLDGGYSVVWLICMYVVGACIKKFGFFSKIKTWVLLILYFGASALILLSMVVIQYGTLHFLGEIKYDEYLLGYLSPLVVVASISLFLVFARIKTEKKWLQSTVSFVSATSFSVYLISEHPYIRDTLIVNQFTFVNSYNPFVGILVVIGFALVIYMACTLIDIPRELLFRAIKLKQKLLSLEKKIFHKGEDNPETNQ